MKNLLIFFIFLMNPVTSFSQNEWSELFYHYQTGTVPPQYYFSYDLTVASGGMMTLAYHPGYQTDSTWTYQLTASSENIAALDKAIKESGVLTETIPELPQEHRPIGGSLSHVIIILQQDPNLDQMPRRITTPEFPVEAFKEKLKTLYEQIVKLVPIATWDEIDSRRGNK